jgi:hypothetical protein
LLSLSIGTTNSNQTRLCTISMHMPQWLRVLVALVVGFCAAAILISPAVDLPDFTTALKAAPAINHANLVAVYVAVPVTLQLQHAIAALTDVRHRPTLPIRFASLFSLTCALLC